MISLVKPYRPCINAYNGNVASTSTIHHPSSYTKCWQNRGLTRIYTGDADGKKNNQETKSVTNNHKYARNKTSYSIIFIYGLPSFVIGSYRKEFRYRQRKQYDKLYFNFMIVLFVYKTANSILDEWNSKNITQRI